ncbi:FecR family protein [Galbibacter mesophilus]|uniref:FecR family protein n=1 Tax=Galbibacter mesophilus TaxID=379069 RepID=UPI00191D1057|nr:FecR domain-containing protein [Galbibacter mesophilus]MCM5662753.1 FecR domain-containing protein [Galbibacter mesophilus]
MNTVKHIIIKSLHQPLSAEEEDELHNWLNKSEKNKALYTKLQDLKTANDLKRISEIDVAKEWNFLEDKHSLNAKASNKRNVLRYLSAAIFIGVVFGSIIMFKTITSPKSSQKEIYKSVVVLENDQILSKSVTEKDEILKNEQGTVVAVQSENSIKFLSGTDKKEALQTVKVPNGKNYTVVLEDSSVVRLNAGSSIQFSNHFTSNSSRVLKLTGEAYFKVSENKEKPFIVKTPKAAIKVLGTSFNVSSYSDENTTKIALVEGKIAIESPSKKFKNQYLLPNQVARVQLDKIEVTNEDVTPHVSWLEGKLIVSEKPFSVVIRQLERKYNVEIENTYSELNSKTFTATFDKESIEEILNSFQLSVPFEYKIKDSKIIINKPRK